MDYKSFYQHKQTFHVDDIYYDVTADYKKEIVIVSWISGRDVIKMAEYDNFEGDMEDFIQERYGD